MHVIFGSNIFNIVYTMLIYIKVWYEYTYVQISVQHRRRYFISFRHDREGYISLEPIKSPFKLR